MIVTAYTTEPKDDTDNGGIDISNLTFEVTDRDLAKLLTDKHVTVKVFDTVGNLIQRFNLKHSARGR